MAYEPKRQPVHGIHRWRGRCGWMRNIATTSEMKMNQDLDSEEPSARAARQKRLLPDSWWDFNRCRQRCWKKQRNQQWKG